MYNLIIVLYIIIELFFLIAKFLKDSPFKNAFEVRYLYILCFKNNLMKYISWNYIY